MPSVSRRIALLLLMLTLPLHGWAQAAASACNAMTGTQVAKHPCCAEKKICADHAPKSSHEQSKPSACDVGGACQCGAGFSITAKPIGVFAAALPATLQADFHFYIAFSDYPPPFRPPINS
jgi:hypothetical protein